MSTPACFFCEFRECSRFFAVSPGACLYSTFDAQFFLTFPHLSLFHYSAIFENVLCIRWFYCAVLDPSCFSHFFAHLLAPVLYLLHFPANFLNVLGNRCSVISSTLPFMSTSTISTTSVLSDDSPFSSASAASN